MHLVIQKDRHAEFDLEPENYVSRKDGAQVATDNLDAEDLRFLAAEAKDEKTAKKLRALAKQREPPLQPGRYLVADRRTGKLIEVELRGQTAITLGQYRVRVKGDGR